METSNTSGSPKIEFFTSPTCVRCPKVKQMLEHILKGTGQEFNQVVKLRDTANDPEAMTDMMMLDSYSTPTVKIKDNVLTGDISESQLREALGLEIEGGR